MATKLVPESFHIFSKIDNYLYLYHLDKFIVLPSYPEQIQDQVTVNYQSSTPLSRSAPIYSYANSGPRSMQITLNLHRELMTQVNYQVSNAVPDMGDDYVDYLIKHVQAAAVPVYGGSSKMVDPPIIAMRFGSDLFCKGVVNGSVGVDYQLPILPGDRYASVIVSFGISEIEAYDAETIAKIGSYRAASIGTFNTTNLNLTLDRNNYKVVNNEIVKDSGPSLVLPTSILNTFKEPTAPQLRWTDIDLTTTPSIGPKPTYGSDDVRRDADIIKATEPPRTNSVSKKFTNEEDYKKIQAQFVGCEIRNGVAVVITELGAVLKQNTKIYVNKLEVTSITNSSDGKYFIFRTKNGISYNSSDKNVLVVVEFQRGDLIGDLDK